MESGSLCHPKWYAVSSHAVSRLVQYAVRNGCLERPHLCAGLLPENPSAGSTSILRNGHGSKFPRAIRYTFQQYGDWRGPTRTVEGNYPMALKQGWPGRVYKDFKVGDVHQHPVGRTITQTDNIWFTLLTVNNNPIHFDDIYAAQTEFKKPLVDSTLTLAVATGLSVPDIS